MSDTLISGLATLHLDVQAAMDGGQIFAELQDAETGLRLGHATMDIDTTKAALTQPPCFQDKPSRC